jgi:hypothetical protein
MEKNRQQWSEKRTETKTKCHRWRQQSIYLHGRGRGKMRIDGVGGRSEEDKRAERVEGVQKSLLFFPHFVKSPLNGIISGVSTSDMIHSTLSVLSFVWGMRTRCRLQNSIPPCIDWKNDWFFRPWPILFCLFPGTFLLGRGEEIRKDSFACG